MKPFERKGRTRQTHLQTKSVHKTQLRLVTCAYILPVPNIGYSICLYFPQSRSIPKNASSKFFVDLWSSTEHSPAMNIARPNNTFWSNYQFMDSDHYIIFDHKCKASWTWRFKMFVLNPTDGLCRVWFTYPPLLRFFFFVWIPFYLQAVQIHSANGVKLLEAWRGVPSSTPPYQ
jgi:hypothetical protein